jgi:hypothetical protein
MKEGRRVMGRKAVLRADPQSKPRTLAARGKLRPCIACKDKGRRDLELYLLKLFRAAYRGALDVWVSGDHSVVFPEGTYRMRWFGALTAC